MSEIPEMLLREVVLKAVLGMQVHYHENPTDAERLVKYAHERAGELYVGRTFAESATILMTLISDWGLSFERSSAEVPDGKPS